jgi:hypothetical protein
LDELRFRAAAARVEAVGRRGEMDVDDMMEESSSARWMWE